MNYRLLLLLTVIVGACNSSKPAKDDRSSLKQEFDRIESLVSTKPDSAVYYYNEAANNTTDSGYKGTWLQRAAWLERKSGDYFGSNETLLESLPLFEKNNPKEFPNISYNYDLLASNFLDLGRYDEAIQYYDLAFQYSDSSNIAYFMSDKGVAFLKKKDYDHAIALFDSAMRENPLDTSLNARIRSNLAKARWLKDPDYKAADEFHEARHLRELINDKSGLNASYAHLSDYYFNSRPDSALIYAEKMFEIARDLDSKDDMAEALEKLIRLTSGKLSRSYFDHYDSLNKSIQQTRSNARNQFADFRYRIQQARAENLLLEKDNTRKKYRISQQLIIIYSIIFLAVAAGIAFFIWYRKRKRIQELQTKSAIREVELKTSQKVHDVVANGLYRIMNELEHKESIDKEPLLDKIEDLYEQSRDISYESSSDSTDSFVSSLNNMLAAFATSSTRVLTVGNNDDIWKDVSPGVKKELETVLQELMVNMKKHSKASNVVLNFQRSDNTVIIIRYKDDGIGLKEGYHKGNGIRSTENRISGMGGSVIFDSSPDNGLTITISIPINKTT